MWPFSSKKSSAGHDVLDRYKSLREAGRDLNLTLAKQLPKDAVPECGKKLGIAKAGTLIFNNDDEVAVLFDYCLYHYRRGNKTVIERRLESPPAADSLDMALLQAMMQARFSAFILVKITPRQGAVVRDLVQGDTMELVDIGISETGTPGTVLLGRLLPLPDFYMSSGALIPLSEPAYQEHILPVIKKFMPDGPSVPHRPMSASQTAAYVAQMIRGALQAGGMDNVFYSDIARFA